MKFRVWCLSWDDTEDNGNDVISYDPVDPELPQHDVGDILVPFYNLASAAEAVEPYAEWCYYNRDGHEDDWPLKFRVRSEDGTVQDFEVDREMVAEFSASPMDRVFAEVHRSNMTKEGGGKRADGKILKGPGYESPDIAAVLRGAAERSK